MIKQFVNYLVKQASLKKIGIGVVLILIFNTIIFPFFPKLFGVSTFPISTILDLKFSYTTDIVYAIFNDLGESGRRVYLLSEILVDFPYALYYGFVYAFILVFLLKKTRIANTSFLILVPFGISFF